ncbi:hypothetical protein BDB00DRAFT_939702 [Zychaea mexicana]|uniref:uncharacterized protein n=1 Tax=Zychaea mexicana TaxID=64656 RepID=UPI0022FEB740|nr:uncharacterized protein BDB00DRAFT_939702 [Zychaea mexicana]KAI9492384.1 hypothetical protein BDB00DRAFT_939702 [Zychaea mexicana]
MHLKEKVVAIYGGTSGIGRELTEKLISLGAYVVFLGTKEEKGKALEKALNEGANNDRSGLKSKRQKQKQKQVAVFYQCDITDWAAQEKLYAVAMDTFGKSIDVVIIIAGVLDSSNLVNDTEKEGGYRTLEINLTAAAKANRLAIQHFVRNNKPGCIINTSSIYGFCGAPLAPLYAASKHGIIGLTKSYGTLFRSTGIRVNAMAPHFVDTPMVTGPSKQVASALGMVSMSRCIDAYIRVIEDDSLDGDVMVITAEKTFVEKRYQDPTFEKLDQLCSERKRKYREMIFEQLQ